MPRQTKAEIAADNAALRARTSELERELADHTRIEVGLRASEARYRRIVETAHQGIWELDAKHTTSYVNHRMAEMLGYAPEEMLGRPLFDFVDEAEAANLVSMLTRRRDGVAEQFERRYRRKGGTELVALVSATPIYDDEGRYAGAFGMLTDITERKREERAMAERTRQFDAVRAVTAEITRELDLRTLLGLITQRATELVGTQSGGIYLWDEATQILYPHAYHGAGWMRERFSRRMGEGLMGHVAQERLGLLVNDYRRSPFAHRRTLETTGITAVLAEPLLYRDRLLGVIAVHHEGSGQVFDEGDQVILRLFASQAAIAIENARLFHEEQRRREQLEAVRLVSAEIARELDLDRLLDLILRRAIGLATAEAGVIVLWNEAEQSLFPRVRIGDFFATMPKRPIPLGEGVVGNVAATRQGLIINDYRTWPGARSDALKYTAITASLGEPLLYRDKLIGVINLIHTAGKGTFATHHGLLLRLFADQAAIAIQNARLFAELRQAYDNLQRAQEESIRSEKLRALGQMAAGIAHDLNNILASILGQVEILGMRVSDPAVLGALRILEVSATDGAQVVRRLQDFTRQQPGWPLAPVDLDSVVREAVEITRPRWKDEPQQRGIVIHVEVSLANLSPVLGYAPEIREALTNLIFNAVDAMPQGGTLTIEAGQEAEPAPQESEDGLRFVELTVKDTGVGMSEGVRQRIFDPFFTTKGVKGTGLGLSAAYGIMQRHGGQITVASAPNQGTTFTLRFLVATDGAASVPGPAAVRTVLPRRLLLIDDDRSVRLTLAELLQEAGHVVSVAEGGAEGLAALRQNSVDIVLTDLGMPEMSGWEVARAVKATEPNLPVILLTGWGEHEASQRDHPGVVDRILGKPVRLNDLLTAICELTGRAAEPTVETT